VALVQLFMPNVVVSVGPVLLVVNLEVLARSAILIIHNVLLEQNKEKENKKRNESENVAFHSGRRRSSSYCIVSGLSYPFAVSLFTILQRAGFMVAELKFYFWMILYLQVETSVSKHNPISFFFFFSSKELLF